MVVSGVVVVGRVVEVVVLVVVVPVVVVVQGTAVAVVVVVVVGQVGVVTGQAARPAAFVGPTGSQTFVGDGAAVVPVTDVSARVLVTVEAAAPPTVVVGGRSRVVATDSVVTGADRSACVGAGVPGGWDGIGSAQARAPRSVTRGVCITQTNTTDTVTAKSSVRVPERRKVLRRCRSIVGSPR
ncbi:hypothetical protein [Nocardia gipuzkoensis]|uniref:hypothetical protein n=1 Tax=Nocardia gipuzkoensis TaxID=2749991 RepID=UPI002458F489|nr:hypothetical protein [Nocardia gipuzkoensis]